MSGSRSRTGWCCKECRLLGELDEQNWSGLFAPFSRKPAPRLAI